MKTHQNAVENLKNAPKMCEKQMREPSQTSHLVSIIAQHIVGQAAEG